MTVPTTMVAPLLLRLLLFEQRGIDPAVFLDPARAREAAALVPSPDERPLAVAAAALAAGEPKRAKRALDGAVLSGDGAAVAAALRAAALNVDLNWSPGGLGAVLDEGDIAQFAGGPLPIAAANDLKLVALVATDLGPSLPSFRTVVSDAINTGRTDVVEDVFRRNGDLANWIMASGLAPVIAYHATCTADLLWRARQFGNASGPLGVAQQAASGDLAALAHIALVWGDWQAEPLSNPELLGLSAPPIGSVPMDVDPDRATARTSYLQADRAYADAGSSRGRAAVALRLAHLERREGRDEARDEALAAAARLATSSGDAALARLIEVHALIDRIGAGADVGAEVIDGIVAWAGTDGSTSWARGLFRLLLDRALAWRQEGEFIAARRALRLSERLAKGLGTRLERPMVDRSVAELYGGANYRRASLVLADLELDQALRTFDPGASDALILWAQLADGAMTIHRDAVGLMDPELILAGARRMDRILALAPPPASAADAQFAAPPEMVAQIIYALQESRRQADVVVPLYRARLAKMDGLLEIAAEGHAEALAAARAKNDMVLECLALAHARRFDEARAIAVKLFETNALLPDMAATLLVQVRAFDRAADALRLIDAAGGPPPSAKPWELLGLRADVALGLRAFQDAADQSDAGINAFESRRARLARDVLRTSATDDPVVAGLYHTAILARIELSDVALAAGDQSRARTLSLESLDLADRLRGSVLSVVAALDALGIDPGSRQAARRWLRAGSRWAAEFEELAGIVAADDGVERDPAVARDRIEVAEEELDDAEAEVARAAPALLEARVGTQGPTGVDLSGSLPADVVLLAYYTFADDLVMWAVTAEGSRHRRVALPAHDLAGQVRRVHQACAERSPIPHIAADLSNLLLAPFEAELGRCPRVVIVPHAALTLLPFHALPLGDDVLGVDHVLSYLPSSSLLTRTAGWDRPRIDAGALVVGDPAYAPDRGLTRLPGTATEARQVSRVLGSDPPLLDAEATEAAVLDRAADRPILHLATHGFVDGRRPNLSFLALAGEDALTVGDLMGIDVQADLVVLSACHSGRGTATAGGDLVGLVRAALAAGARHLVVSLWPVDDEAGCLIVSEFYRHLAADSSVAEALALAQLHVRGLDRDGRRAAYEALCAEQGAPAEVADGPRDIGGVLDQATVDAAGHPYHWAPFVHVGLP